MKEKILTSDHEDQYGFKPLSDNVSEKRLDLNDLIKRSKEIKRNEKKNNFFIFLAAILIIWVFGFIISFSAWSLFIRKSSI